jgi:hypothetical protein
MTQAQKPAARMRVDPAIRPAARGQGPRRSVKRKNEQINQG